MVYPLSLIIELFINIWYNILVFYRASWQKGGNTLLSIFLTIENEEERNLAEKLYLTYKSKMYGIAYSILHNKEDAEDTVMDSVYKIVNNISKFTDADRNRTESLIVIIVRNTATIPLPNDTTELSIPLHNSSLFTDTATQIKRDGEYAYITTVIRGIDETQFRD